MCVCVSEWVINHGVVKKVAAFEQVKIRGDVATCVLKLSVIAKTKYERVKLGPNGLAS